MSLTSEAEWETGKTEVKERTVESDGVKGRDLLNKEEGVGRVAGGEGEQHNIGSV